MVAIGAGIAALGAWILTAAILRAPIDPRADKYGYILVGSLSVLFAVGTTIWLIAKV